MKIGPLEPKTIAAPASAERKASPQPASAEPSAQVRLSNAAQGLQASEGDPAFDGAKVERIAQAIRDGKFTVNPEAIADKLIVNAQELLSRKPN
jgi:negative regulator of flagellin synthesis FlgM